MSADSEVMVTGVFVGVARFNADVLDNLNAWSRARVAARREQFAPVR